MRKPLEYKTARFIFDGWDDTPLKKKYDGYFEFFEEQIRYTPDCPEIFKFIPTIWFPPNQNLPAKTKAFLNTDEAKKIRDNIGKGQIGDPEREYNSKIEKGLILEATYDATQINPEDIEKFFSDYKIHVHRLDPFIVEETNIVEASDKEAFSLMDWIKKHFP